MATKVEAAHLMMVNAARLKDAGERNDVEAGMAKCSPREYCAEVTQESFRIHGGYGYSKEYEIERLMREAPFLLIGEGTSEIQKTIISRGLLQGVQVRAIAARYPPSRALSRALRPARSQFVIRSGFGEVNARSSVPFAPGHPRGVFHSPFSRRDRVRRTWSPVFWYPSLSLRGG